MVVQQQLRLSRDQLAKIAKGDPEAVKQLEKLFSRVNTLSTGGLPPDGVYGDVTVSGSGTIWTVTASAVADGDYGDITVSGGGTVFTIDASVVTNAKMANMPTLTFKGNSNGFAAGPPEDMPPFTATQMLTQMSPGGGQGVVPDPVTTSGRVYTDAGTYETIGNILRKGGGLPPPGEAGEDGEAGPPGPPGAAGVAGAAGAAGLPGPPGWAGEDGDDGAPGPPGINGAAGAAGAAGLQGPPGWAGDDGDDGPWGPPGRDGVIGRDGAAGQPGPPGPPGEDGDQGIQGPQGVPGPQAAAVSKLADEVLDATGTTLEVTLGVGVYWYELNIMFAIVGGSAGNGLAFGDSSTSTFSARAMWLRGEDDPVFGGTLALPFSGTFFEGTAFKLTGFVEVTAAGTFGFSLAEGGAPTSVTLLKSSGLIVIPRTSSSVADTTPRLNELRDPNGSVQFAQQQALQFRIENRTSDPGAPAVGEIWLRTDL